jgi:hypothetical protein
MEIKDMSTITTKTNLPKVIYLLGEPGEEIRRVVEDSNRPYRKFDDFSAPSVRMTHRRRKQTYRKKVPKSIFMHRRQSSVSLGSSFRLEKVTKVTSENKQKIKGRKDKLISYVLGGKKFPYWFKNLIKRRKVNIPWEEIQGT